MKRVFRLGSELGSESEVWRCLLELGARKEKGAATWYAETGNGVDGGRRGYGAGPPVTLSILFAGKGHSYSCCRARLPSNTIWGTVECRLRRSAHASLTKASRFEVTAAIMDEPKELLLEATQMHCGFYVQCNVPMKHCFHLHCNCWSSI
jgi:hypothetical protein